ncbi:putative conserved membrane protein [Synechococcus sp. ROS8604]|nr:putative conserved membrane protein [Synechococcus sp. ROS8604]
MENNFITMELFVGICIIPFLSALFIQAGQNDDADDHDFL